MSILSVDEYQNDPRIKKMNSFRYILPSTWTKNELEEWMKCKLDINYFIDNYFYIMDEYKGGIRVKAKDTLYPPQRELVNNIFDKRKVIVLKSRQTGITTIITQVIIWLQLFNRQYKIGILSHKQEHQSGTVDRKIKTSLRYLPPVFVKPVKVSNKTQMIFDDGDGEITWILQEQPGPNSQPFTGETVNFLFLDEQQKIRSIESHLKSLLPAMQTTLSQPEEQQLKRPQAVQVVSTPNGISDVGEWYFKTWSSCKTQYENSMNKITESLQDSDISETEKILMKDISDQNYAGYFPQFIHWKDCGLTDEWYEQQKQILQNDPIQIQQELEQQFIGSQITYFPSDYLTQLQQIKPLVSQKIEWVRMIGLEPVTKDNRLQTSEDGYPQMEEITNYQYLNVWEYPIEDVEYVVGVDPATGGGREFSQISVINGITGIQQQEWKGKINTVDLQYLIKKIQEIYNYQLVGIESNQGYHLIDKLLYEQRYENLFSDKNGKQGIYVTQANRKIIIDMITSMLPDYNFENWQFIKSRDLISELFTFEYKFGRGEHKSGKFDDLIFQFQYQQYVREMQMDQIIKSSSIAQIKDHQVIQQIKKEQEIVEIFGGIKETTGINTKKSDSQYKNPLLDADTVNSLSADDILELIGKIQE